MSTLATLPLVRLSICDCGFLTLRDDIALGAFYELDLSQRCVATYICGGCKASLDTAMIYAMSKGDGDGGWMPLRLFIK